MPNALNLSGIAITVEQGKWKRLANRLAREVLAPSAAQVDQESRFPRENLKALGEAGLMGLPAPKDLGGPGGNILTTTFVVEELAHGCASTATCYTMHTSAVPVIAALVNDGQKEKFLTPIIRGDILLSVAMTEPGSGNRLWHMDSYAVEDGDDYIIDSVSCSLRAQPIP